MISHQQGSYLALLTELKTHGLAELKRLEKKLARGNALNASELDHVAHWVEQTQKLASLEQQANPKAPNLTSQDLSELLNNISQKALNIAKK